MADSYAITAFSVQIDDNSIASSAFHLYANGNQQVRIRINIRKHRFSTGEPPVFADLTYDERRSLRLRELGQPAGAALPAGWSISTNRNIFDMGVNTSPFSQWEQITGDAQQTDTPIKPAVEDYEVFYFYVSTSSTITRNFVAEVTLAGGIVIGSSDTGHGFQASQVQIRPAAPVLLRRTDFSVEHKILLDEKINGKKNTWWWLQMSYFHLLQPNRFRILEVTLSNIPFYSTSAAYRTFSRNGNELAGVMHPTSRQTSTASHRAGYTSNPSAYSRSFNLDTGDLVAFAYKDTDINVPAFSIPGPISILDTYGTRSTINISLGSDRFPILVS